ncbi:hybrid sensor histidine kinase/response regulator [Methylocapsa sp. S129]|uniref:hybrid sensor histidine kinase/response regulator n=1 Tax=Methylocapsa sp. S129 TaxID=1641869 RepID=UPI00131DCD91|nr:hybrid sensor histidine kinase/response regulator [Methylocapsa sp. S129]
MPGKLRTIELLRFLLVASIAGPAILLAAVAWLTYQAAFVDAKHEIIRTSEVAREHASKVFDSFALVSDRVQGLLDRLDDKAITASEESLHNKFVEIIRDLPQIQSLIVLDRDARPLVATAAFPVASSEDFSDRDYFGALTKGGAVTYISKLQTSRINGKTFFGWGQARRGPDGAVAGVVDIAISPSFFMRFYDTLVREVGEGLDGRVVTMIRDDGQILVRYPAFEGNPAPISSSNPFFAAIHTDPNGGAYVNRSVIDSDAPERLYAFRKVPGHPIYIVAGRSFGAVTSEWLHGMFAYLAVGVAGALALFLVTLATLRGARREQEALAQVREEMARRELAEDQLRQAQKMEAVGQLTGGIAHDFNNLLTVIRSSIDLLRRPDLADDRRRRYLDAISDTTTRATKLTGQLLAFARRQALKPEAFNIVDNVTKIIEMVRALTGSRIAIETHLPDEPLYINADPSQFDTSIVNVAVNARDAMNGEGRLTITVKAVSEIPALRSRPAAPGDYIAVAMSDTGAGVASDKLEQIFEPFFTTKGIGHGTGLGLSQVFGFAKQSGGEVTVESEVGRGATFTLYLPRAAADSRPDEATRESPPADGHDACVLVVEDNADVGALAAQTLTELGYSSVRTANAEEALAELAKNAERFDVVFSDVVMPGMNGVELGREIRRRYADLPVVLTSGYSHALARNGADGFELLHKPYSVEQLSRALHKAANRRPV